MSSMAWRSKLWGHFVLVTGFVKGSRVSGHLSEMRSRSMEISSESAGNAERSRFAWRLVRRECGEVVVLAAAEDDGFAVLFGSSRCANHVEGSGTGGMSFPG